MKRDSKQINAFLKRHIARDERVFNFDKIESSAEKELVELMFDEGLVDIDDPKQKNPPAGRGDFDFGFARRLPSKTYKITSAGFDFVENNRHKNNVIKNFILYVMDKFGWPVLVGIVIAAILIIVGLT